MISIKHYSLMAKFVLVKCQGNQDSLTHAVITMGGTFLVPNHAGNSFTFGTKPLLLTL